MSVSVECGVNSAQGEYAGRTVGDVRTMLRQALNIDPTARVVVNGNRNYVADYELSNGDIVEFIKAAGEKGA